MKPCKICKDKTINHFNINFKAVPICESCANQIMLQQSSWLAENCQQNVDVKKIKWEGFDYALALLDEMYASSHPHKFNIADCIKAKVNRLPKNKVRKTKP